MSEQPNSKAIRVSGERQTGQIIKRLNYNPIESPNIFDSEVPDLGKPHPTREGLFFIDADWRPTAGHYGDLVLNYSWIKDGETKSELRASTFEAPLSSHVNYQLNWDHNLMSLSADDPEPSWWKGGSAVKTFDEFKAQNTENKYFLKTNANAKSENEFIISARVYNQNSYKKPTFSVLETVYWSKLSDATKETFDVGELHPPGFTFGRNEDPATRWLVTDAPITREGGYWVVKKVYQYNDSKDPFLIDAQGWPFDIYA